MKSQNLICGIDVSKDSLDIYFNEGECEHCLKITNDSDSHDLLIKRLGIQRTYVMESSGPYYLKLAFKLKLLGADVRVENPIVVKRFIQMNLERNKSDKKDARWLFRYAQQIEAAEWKLPSKQQLQSSQILASIDLYQRQITMITNQLHSLDQLPLPSADVKKSLMSIKLRIQAEVKKMEVKLHHNLEQWNPGQLKCLSSVPGLGKRAVALLIVYTDGFKKIQNHRQLIALSGLSPREHTSGSSVRGKKGICKMGNGHLRSVLYMCAMSAIKHNQACKELFQRLKAKGKPGKLALIAVCNKLLKQAFAIATKGMMYKTDYTSSLR
jgi:transposase